IMFKRPGMSRRQGRLIVTLSLAAAGVAAPVLHSAPLEAAPATVQILEPADFTKWGYGPSTVTVNAGEAVTCVNAGAIIHSVTAVSGAFDSGQIAAGGQFSFVAQTPGTFASLCAFHPTMLGTLIVQPAAAPVAAPDPAPAPSPDPVSSDAPPADPGQP